MNDVIIPTGKTMGDIIVLANVSEMSRSVAPSKPEIGIKYL